MKFIMNFCFSLQIILERKAYLEKLLKNEEYNVTSDENEDEEVAGNVVFRKERLT